MSLRAKTFWLLIALLAAFSAISYAIHHMLVIPSFAALERREAFDDLDRVLDALNRELHHLDLLTNDWAAWDDSYDFVAAPSATFRESNLNPETFVGTRIDLVQYLDLEGRVVADVRIDSRNGERYRFEALPSDRVAPEHPLRRRIGTTAEPVSGVLISPDGQALLVAARPIVPSDRGAEPRGTLVMGRLVDDDLVDDLAAQTRLPLEAAAISSDRLLSGATASEWLERAGPNPTIEELNGETLAAVATARDLWGRPALVFTALMPRPIVLAGRNLAGLAIPLIGIAALVVALFLAFALTHQVVRPIERMTRFVGNIEVGGDLRARIGSHRNDELGHLSEGIDKMLGALDAQTVELDQALAAAHSAADARSAFLARMSHELRTPLHGILGMTGLLVKSDLDEVQAEQAKTVLDSANLLLTIINEVLDISKIEADKLVLEFVSADIAEVVQRTVALLRNAAEAKGITLDARIDPSLPRRVEADSVRLRQILNNLVGNAVKFTDSGTVRISLVVTEDTPDFVRVRFEVSDTGEGIAAEELDDLFDAFVQASAGGARQEGTGLGLTISQRLVQMMGGEIDVRSVVGEGSTFSFEVPFRRVEPVERTRTDLLRAVAKDGEQETGAPVRAKRILVADDNMPSRQFALFLLEPEGFVVDTVTNGAEAVEAVRSADYDLVLMDSQMPVMTGFEATAAIRALGGPCADVPIIAVTAEAMRGDYDACLSAGMNDYVAKPIDPDQLLTIIARYLQDLPTTESGDHA